MKNIRLLLKYFLPYRWSAVRSIIYNIFSAVFALVSYTLIMPFLNILFDRVDRVPDPGPFLASTKYLDAFSKYYIFTFVDEHGKTGALLLVVIVVVVASLFKNGFIFLCKQQHGIYQGKYSQRSEAKTIS